MEQRWRELCNRIGARRDVEAVYALLDAGYGDKGRHYHNWRHVAECLDLLDLYDFTDTHRRDVIEAALWFHDVVYKARSGDNEEKSAECARQCARQMGVLAADSARIEHLIMATKKHEAGGDADCEIITDIDLSILGADGARYDEYERDIRREYSWVPALIFRPKRRAILENFLARDVIYQTAPMRAQREEQARINLRCAIDQLA